MQSHSSDSAVTTAEPGAVSPLRRFLRLCVSLGVLLLIMYVIAPFLVEHIAPFRKYAQTVEETGIMPGALYYTDVPQSTDAEVNNRNTIRFMVNRESKNGSR
jgi:hypothetical protein